MYVSKFVLNAYEYAKFPRPYVICPSTFLLEIVVVQKYQCNFFFFINIPLLIKLHLTTQLIIFLRIKQFKYNSFYEME